jgi:hypothetical protein
MMYVNIDIFLIFEDTEELFYVKVNRVFAMATSWA